VRTSLKWQIAASYCALLIVVMAIVAGLIGWRFQAILYDEARARVDATMRQIATAAAPPPNPFTMPDVTGDSLALLFNSNNLAIWESPSTFIQIDSPNGYPLAKTSNLGGALISPNPNISPANDAAYRQISIAGRPFLVEDRLIRAGAAGAIVHVAEPLDALERAFAQIRATIVLVLAGAILAVFLLSIALASRAIDPITELANAMRGIGHERLELRLSWKNRSDEIGKLAESFNDLLARLQEAFARERQFISDASHELKTPLTSINANAQMLLRWGDRDEAVRRESLETIVDESSTLAGMVNGMLTLAKADRGDEIPKEPTSLAHIVGDVVRNAQTRAAEKGLALHFDPGTASPIVYADGSLLRQLASNLVDNAIKFTDQGRIDVRVGADTRNAWVEVADNGPGIPPDEIDHVFDRFYRADKARSREIAGTGLGLAIVRSIARVHGGTVTAGAAPGGGALFRATFPRIDEALTGIS
jgi:signal transduction histidine kinase